MLFPIRLRFERFGSVSRSVSAEGYISQSGTEVITADLTRRVSPVLADDGDTGNTDDGNGDGGAIR